MSAQPCRFLILDKSSSFAARLTAAAALKGWRVRHHVTLVDILYEPLLGAYEGIIVGCLEPIMSRAELQQYFKVFFADVPVFWLMHSDEGGVEGATVVYRDNQIEHVVEVLENVSLGSAKTPRRRRPESLAMAA